jgi:hypothetical protein
MSSFECFRQYKLGILKSSFFVFLKKLENWQKEKEENYICEVKPLCTRYVVKWIC